MSAGAGPHDTDPPDLLLVVKVAAEDLRAIYLDPDRDTSDVVRAIDALGRALARLKAHLRADL